VGDEFRGSVRGAEGCTTSTFGTFAISVIGAKLRTGSIAELRVKPGVDCERADVPDENGVAIGGDFAAASAPIEPPAPPRFST